MDQYVGRGSAQALPNVGFDKLIDGGRNAQYELRPTEPQVEPIFSLGNVQFSLPSPLFALQCQSNILYLLTLGSPSPSPKPPTLIRIDLSASGVENIDIPLPPPSGIYGSPPRSPNPRRQSIIQPRDGEDKNVSKLYKMHVDPSGRHVLISTTLGDNFYLYTPLGYNVSSAGASTRKMKPLSKSRGLVISSVGWNPLVAPSSANPSTYSILLGTTTGQIFESTFIDSEYVPQEGGFAFPSLPGQQGRAIDKYHKLLFSLPANERQSVVGLRWESWGGRESLVSLSGTGAGSGSGRKAAVLCCTRSRMYQFVGVLTASSKEELGWDGFFAKFENVSPKSLELPGDVSSSLHFFSPPALSKRGDSMLAPPKSMAWLVEPGVYYGTLGYPSSAPVAGDGIVDSGQLVPYPSTGPARMTSQGRVLPRNPIGLALTEFHFVLLYEDKVVAVNNLDNKVVWEKELDLKGNESPLGITADHTKRLYWVYTSDSIFELKIVNEDRNVWKILLEKGNFDTALKYAKSTQQRDAVLTSQGDSFFNAAKYIPAAQAYAKSSKPFEEVVLKLVEKDERDALRYYLMSKLERLSKKARTQRIMLATWLVEMYLAKINQLEDFAASESSSEDAENFHAEKAVMEEDMKQFLDTYKDNLDVRTTFDLITNHGRDDILLHFATLVGDWERIITYWVRKQNWTKALDTLNRQDDDELFYRFSPALIRAAPKQTVDILQRHPNLDVRRLLPALVQPSRHAGTTDRQEQVIRYLMFSILQLHNTDPAVHNALLTLFATSPSQDETPLLRFLAASSDDPDTGRPYYDLDYALRTCKANNRIQSCVDIYAKMGLWESSVDLALEKGDVELAITNADKASEEGVDGAQEGLRKRLWLKVARYVVVEKQDIKMAMKFLESTDLLKIEDILPFFPDFVVIDEFKDDICNALEGYAGRIDRLKEEMNDATRSAEAIKADIADLRTRFVVLDEGEKCSSCGKGLLTRQFYVFPCQHGFHADCLVEEVTQHLSPSILRRIIDLQNRIALETEPPAPSSQRAPAAITPAFAPNPGMAANLPKQFAAVGVRGLDELRRLVVPDALVGIITGDLLTGTRRREDEKEGIGRRGSIEVIEKLRMELDDLIAASCVLCDTSLASLDRPFVADGETM
ncbi:hypothetical protein BT69DRAFT_1267230 [Atractiella rhizophila]|nr:hypothetical protein BT69DRAFT_1267230 [Atractiella rhizophila]